MNCSTKESDKPRLNLNIKYYDITSALACGNKNLGNLVPPIVSEKRTSKTKKPFLKRKKRLARVKDTTKMHGYKSPHLLHHVQFALSSESLISVKLKFSKKMLVESV